MKKFILFFLIGLFLFDDSLRAMDPGDSSREMTRSLKRALPDSQFQLLEDLSTVSEEEIITLLKRSSLKMGLGSLVIACSPYMPNLGENLLSPKSVKMLGRAGELLGMLELISALREQYNIIRGGRLPQPDQPDLWRNVRNGGMDVIIAGFIYTAHHRIPYFLMDSYVELAGPSILLSTASFLALRGIKDLLTYVPTWGGDLHWSSAAQNVKERAVPAFQYCIGKVGEVWSGLSSCFAKKPLDHVE